MQEVCSKYEIKKEGDDSHFPFNMPIIPRVTTRPNFPTNLTHQVFGKAIHYRIGFSAGWLIGS